MKKEDRIGVRVSVELKKALIQIAKHEDRSLAQVWRFFSGKGLCLTKRMGQSFSSAYSDATNDRLRSNNSAEVYLWFYREVVRPSRANSHPLMDFDFPPYCKL